ncbi:beta strand repeat-containing protein [Pontiella sulfatireligans]|uniref:Adhesin BmaC autotransporter n=1 Tax=Pontiella sulfatireligans TaxID=2750658 RepID=A0A6C2UK63_9BACT|nr:autotransporter-associated beta strand repeat-containing protein [Pontiella sulfatireligans]VGO19801.1 Adhesin BmaC autotransporter [Pontiella sulfatireligans]
MMMLTKRALIPALLAVAAGAFAADIVWSNAPSSALWTNTANWTEGTMPVAGDTALFNNAGGADDTIDLTGISSAIKYLYFDGASVDSYTIGSGGAGSQTLTLDSAGIGVAAVQMNGTSGADQIIDANLAYTSGGHLNNFSTQTLTVNGDVSQSTGWFTINGADGSTIKLLGNNNSVASGVSVKTGGTVELNSMNSKPVYVAGGTLKLNNAMAFSLLGMGNANTEDRNSILDVSSSGYTQNGDIIYSADTDFANTALIHGGDITMANWKKIDVADNTLISGAELTISNNITTSGVNKHGDGTLRLAGDNSGIASMYLREGTVQVDSDANLNSGVIQMGYADTTGTLEFTGGTGTIDNAIRVGSTTAGTGGGTILANGSGAVTFSANTATHADASGARTLTLGGSNTDDNTFSGAIYNTDSDSEVSLTKADSGTWVLGGANGYTGTTTVEEGTLKLGADNRIHDSSVLVVESGGTFDMNSFNETIGGLSGSGLITNTLDTTAGKNLVVNQDIDTTFSGRIDYNEPGNNKYLGLVKKGTGTLTLTGDNNFNNVAIQGGTVAINSDDALGHNNWSDQIGGNSTDGTLEFVGGNDIAYNNKYSIGNPNATTDTAGGTFKASLTDGAKVVVSGNMDTHKPTVDRTLTLAGISTADNELTDDLNDFTTGGGKLNIVKQDAGKWILSGNSTRTGTTDIQAGRLDVTGSEASAITVQNGATLGGEGSSSANVTIGNGSGAGILAIDGSTAGAFSTTADLDTQNGVSVLVEKAGIGTFKVIDYGTWNDSTDDFSINAGGVQASGRGETFADSGTGITLDMGFASRTWSGGGANPTFWDNGTTLNWTEDDQKFFDGDAVTFGDTGAGTVALQGNVDVAGVTFNNASGNSYALSGNQLATTDGISIDGTGDVTISSVIAGNGGLTKTGNSDGSTLTLNAANTYTGGTTLSAGYTVVGNSQAFGSGDVRFEDLDGDNNLPVITLTDGVNVANALTVANDGWTKKIQVASGGANTAEWSGDISILETAGPADNGWVQFNAGGVGQELKVSGDITGTNIKLGSTGVLNLTGNNSLDGISMINWGSTLRAGSDTALGGALVQMREHSTIQLTDGVTIADGTSVFVENRGALQKVIEIVDMNNGVAESATFNGNIFVDEKTAGDFRVNASDASDTITLGGTIGGTNATGLVATGAGTKILAGSNTYNGTTTVQDGLLVINGDNSAATGDVTVNSGAALGGSGIIGGATTVAGALNPGNSPGTLTFNEDLTLTSTSVTTLEIDSLTLFDILANDGGDTITFEDGASIVFDTTGYTAVYGETFQVLDNWNDIAGTLANLTITGTEDLGSGLSLDTSDLLVDGSVTVIPEPAVITLIVALGGTMIFIKRLVS